MTHPWLHGSVMAVHVDGPVARGSGLGVHAAQAGVLEGRHELSQAGGHPPHNVARVPILGQNEGQLEVVVLLQPNFLAVLPGKPVCGAFGYGHHTVPQVVGDGVFSGLWLVLVKQSPQLEGVELEATGGDGGNVIGTCLGRRQEDGCLG